MERNVFAAIKHTGRSVVVILSVGGKRNPNVTPQQIVFFTKEKWEYYKSRNMTVREILYGDNKKRRVDTSFLEKIQKNRVTVAHCES